MKAIQTINVPLPDLGVLAPQQLAALHDLVHHIERTANHMAYTPAYNQTGDEVETFVESLLNDLIQTRCLISKEIGRRPGDQAGAALTNSNGDETSLAPKGDAGGSSETEKINLREWLDRFADCIHDMDMQSSAMQELARIESDVAGKTFAHFSAHFDNYVCELETTFLALDSAASRNDQ